MPPLAEEVESTLNPVGDEEGFLSNLDKSLETLSDEDWQNKSGEEDKKPDEEPPPKKEEEVKVEDKEDVKPEDNEDDEWWKDAKAGEAFSKIKGENKSLSERLRLLEKENDELKTKSGRIGDLEKELGSTRDRLAAFDLEGTATYQNEITNPMNNTLDQLKDLAGDEIVRALNIASARERLEAIAKITEDLGKPAQARIERLVDKVDDLVVKRDEMRENAKGKLAEIQEKEKLADVEAKEARAKENAAAVEAVFDKIAQRLPFLKDADTGEISSEAQKLIEEAKKTDLHEVSPMVRGYAAFASAAMIPLMKQMGALKGELAEANKQLSKYKGARPGGGKGDATADKGGSGKPVSQGGFLDNLNKAIEEAGQEAFSG